LNRDVRAITAELVALISASFPDAVQSKDGGDIGFGFTQGYKGLVFSISPQKEHVTLGVAQGAGLQESFPMLQGSGKVHRHVKITSLEGVSNPELKRLIRAALNAARARQKAGA